MENLKKEFAEMTNMSMFKISVVDTRSGDSEYITFDISIDGDDLRAEHVSLTEEEETSELIAFKSVELDDVFSLDENLQALYDECQMGILNSDFFELTE